MQLKTWLEFRNPHSQIRNRENVGAGFMPARFFSLLAMFPLLCEDRVFLPRASSGMADQLNRNHVKVVLDKGIP